jgi:hypothetical protein
MPATGRDSVKSSGKTDGNHASPRIGITALALVLLPVIAQGPTGAGAAAAPETMKNLPAEVRALAGQWVRADYPYTIEIQSVNADGTLEATYRNPRPINVGRAVFVESVAGPVVTVELRDDNYPGSTYTLTYDRTRDFLYGTYYQAVQGETFAVIFTRSR